MPLEVRQAALLHDMLESARRATQYMTGRSRSDLDSDFMLADAVERRLEIIGEAARGLPEDFKSKYPEIPWRAIMATRHVLAHDYDEVNHDIILADRPGPFTAFNCATRGNARSITAITNTESLSK